MKRHLVSLFLGVLMLFGVVAQSVQSHLSQFAQSVNLHVRAVAYIGYCHLTAIMGRMGLIVYVNTITNLIPTLYEALDVVSREMIGFIPAVARNSSADRAALNQTINIPIAPAATTGDVTPAATPPNDGDQTAGNTTMTISKSKYSPVRWSGEEQKSIATSGMSNTFIRDQFAQSMRALVNLVEVDLAALSATASRAYGTAGTSPFTTANDFSDFANVNKILDDNGAPVGNRHLVLGSAAKAKLQGVQSLLFKANEAGTSDLLRLGIIGQVEGLMLHSSSQVRKSVTAGTGASATTNAAGYAIGATVITLAVAGTGTILAGDSITITGDGEKYIVTAGDTDVSNGGTFTIQEPGLMKAIPAAATALTITAATDHNMAFDGSAIQLITRAPALPDGGDMADDRTMIVDPISGLAFEVSVYREYRRVKYEVALAWGVKMVVPRHTMRLIGPAS